jgi:hypothetical protein
MVYKRYLDCTQTNPVNLFYIKDSDSFCLIVTHKRGKPKGRFEPPPKTPKEPNSVGKFSFYQQVEQQGTTQKRGEGTYGQH